MNVNSDVTKNELTSLNGVKKELNQLSKVKFIPDSGAAARMFKNLHTYILTYGI